MIIIFPEMIMISVMMVNNLVMGVFVFPCHL